MAMISSACIEVLVRIPELPACGNLNRGVPAAIAVCLEKGLTNHGFDEE